MEVVVSQVCERWRAVAISNPSLWTRIEARAKPVKALVQGVMQCWEAYLSRSKNRLLDVTLFSTVDGAAGPWEDLDWGQELLRVVVPHSERWRSFTLHIPYVYSRNGWSGEDLVAVLRNVSVPQLQVVDLCVDRPDDFIDVYGPQIFLPNAPRLSKLNLGAMGSFWPLMPMDTITTLTVQAFNTPAPFLLLLSLPRLRHLGVIRKRGWPYAPLSFDGIDEDQMIGPTSQLLSLRLTSCDNLPSLFEFSPLLWPAFAQVKHLFISDGEDSDATYSYLPEDAIYEDEFEPEDWRTLLDEQLNQHNFDLFPSLEHLVVRSSSAKLQAHSSLYRLTHNIRMLTVLPGYLELDDYEEEEMEEEPDTTWPHLCRVRFGSLPKDEDELEELAAWLTERGCRFKGRFVVALGHQVIAELEKRGGSEVWMREMKEVVRIETAGIQDDISWPPEGNEAQSI